jgi:hypothetical protein
MALDFRTYEQKKKKKMGGIDYEGAPMPVQIGGMIGQYLQKGEDWAVGKAKDKWSDIGGLQGVKDWIKSPLDVTELEEPSSVKPLAPDEEIGQTDEIIDSPIDYSGDSEEPSSSLLNMVTQKKSDDYQASYDMGQTNRVAAPGYDHFASKMLASTDKGGFGGVISQDMQNQLGLNDVFGEAGNKTIASQLTNKEKLKTMFDVDSTDLDEMDEFYGYFKSDGSLDYHKLSDKHREALNLKIWQRMGSNEQSKYSNAATTSSIRIPTVNVTGSRPEPVPPPQAAPVLSDEERRERSNMQADLEGMSSRELESPEGRKLAKDLGLSEEDYWALYQQYTWEEDPANKGEDKVYPGSPLDNFPGLLGKMLAQTKGSRTPVTGGI